MMADDQHITRGFRIVFPDGYVVHGAQFPSGRCVLDDTHNGLIEAAVSIDELPMARKPLARIEWAAPVVLERVCCEYHNQHCEPPSELCCRWCTEAIHPEHPVGVTCVLDLQAAGNPPVYDNDGNLHDPGDADLYGDRDEKE